MARLNTHLSATPQLPPATRSSTVDSLYRDPSVARHSTPRASTYSVLSPSSPTSDKENNVPDSREETPRLASKLRHRMDARTPSLSVSADSPAHPSKRRRTGDYATSETSYIQQNGGGEVQIYQDEEDAVDQERDDAVDDEDHNQGEAEQDDDEDAFTKYYNPQQDPELRRQVRANIRQHQREIEDKRDELIQPNDDGLMKHIKRQNYYMGKVKQTAEAALDARVLVFASDLAGKKLKNTLHGNSSVGIDVDQFVSRCIHFMKSGGNPAPHNATPSTQGRHRRRTAAEEDEDDDEDTGEALDWALMGKEACFPFNRRPPVSGFLLGPLSVQKRARASQARRARSQRQPVAPTTRPQELTQADIKQSENSNLPHLVKGIKNRLETHLSENTEKVEAELEEFEGEPDDEDVEAASRRHRVYISPDGEAAANFFDFVINPSSFGQTVENMFYVSFLIKEGNVKIVLKDDMPLLVPSEPRSMEEQRRHNVQKHQAVFSLDWPTWKKFIYALDIKEPLIPHRVSEATTVSAGGWYG